MAVQAVLPRPYASLWLSGIFKKIRNLGRNPSRGWQSSRTAWPLVTLLLVSQVALIAAVVALVVVSKRSNGFAAIGSLGFLDNPLVDGFLWQGLPPIIFTIYKTAWEAIVEDFADRQPFVELRKPGGGPPSKTIALDYRTHNRFWRPVVAFKNRHWILALTMLLNLLATFVLVPFSSYIMNDAPTLVTTTFNSRLRTSFDVDGITSLPDLGASMDVAFAALMLGGRWPAWTDGKYAFQAFEPPQYTKASNISTTVEAYYSELDCRILSEAEYSVEYRTESVKISAEDRGCAISTAIQLDAASTSFVESWSTVGQCSGKETRLSLIAGDYAPILRNSTAELTFISCVPTYSEVRGTVSMAFDIQSSPFPISFRPNAETSRISSFQSTGINAIYEPALQSITGYDAFSAIEGNNFGQYLYRMVNQSGVGWDSNAILNATAVLFNSIFATTTATSLMASREDLDFSSCTGTVASTRAFMIYWNCYLELAILAAMVVCTLGLLKKSGEGSILFEEPKGLLSYAGIVDRSDLVGLVARIQGAKAGPSYEGNLHAAAKPELEGTSWYRIGGTPITSEIKCFRS
ncbi:hypothetical protein BU26DRAFT_516858 [Trematosphaeria pertusa]|uniref:Uncharacterized protein n=1 Tax=Trematosphaeria pertusa TaxID=390896 RepID=A0A6A6INX2_9PLEO|nr:uncharacterized protein BU26DRAFT_516858 [Trematosphaeria pertusa]KAF2252171.1 hypothetical protein BU26DRAFT_516858 [Trematosphaeria pertusa]